MHLTIKKIIVNVEAPRPASLALMPSGLMDILKTGQAPAALRRAVPLIGEHWDEQGGVYGGIMRAPKGLPHYHLIAPNIPDVYTESIKWGTENVEEPNAICDRDGLANTLALVSSAHEYPAAQWAHGLSVNGFNDFYLPARREARLLWVNVPELFAEGAYWTSTHYSRRYAWYQDFSDGYQGTIGKGGELRARVARRSLID